MRSPQFSQTEASSQRDQAIDGRTILASLTVDQCRAIFEERRDASGHRATPTAPREVLDTVGACDLLRCSRATLYRWGVPFRMVGDSRRYLRSELIEWIKNGGTK
jgi:hypothetical protein